jgi:tRNA(Ile)-lysidine synthase
MTQKTCPLAMALTPFKAEIEGGLVIAVSGGRDSFALLHAAHLFCQAQGNDRLIAVTVDHNLRQDSQTEARIVAAWCADRGISHHTLTLPRGSLSQHDLQNQARLARYAALSEFCQGHGIKVLMTAHHQNDQIETFIQRLGRSSGLRGLAAIRPRTERHGILILRPFLGICRDQLTRYVQEHDLPFVDDPSNQNHAFERVKIRDSLGVIMPALGWSQDRLGDTITKLGRADQALENWVSRILLDHARARPDGVITCDWSRAHEWPPEIKIRVLDALIRSAGGRRTHPINDTKLETLLEKFIGPNNSVTTLGHAQITFDAANLRLSLGREGRHPPVETILMGHGKTLWDGRFLIENHDDDPVLITPKAAVDNHKNPILWPDAGDKKIVTKFDCFHRAIPLG